LVTYGTVMVDGHAAFAVNWVDVGYYYVHYDKLNSFQLVMIDRSDRGVGDFDIEFNYEQIQWETGDASGGSNGFGGESARAGFSNGSGEEGTYYEFESSGIDGAFLDSSPETGLIYGSQNSAASGRYIFSVTGGIPSVLPAARAKPIHIHIEDGCILNGQTIYDWDVNGFSWDVNSHNINEDPNFVYGYHLSQFAAGQATESNCVDGGSDLAGNVGMDEYSTRADGEYDIGQVDMGYHYGGGISQYRMTVEVIPDGNGLTHGYVEPNSAIVYEWAGENVVTLTAHPDIGYRVRRWVNTDDDMSTALTNTVTVTRDMTVTVEFEPTPVHLLTASVVGGHGSVDPTGGLYYEGDTAVFTATAEPGYYVEGWYDHEGTLVSVINTLEVVVESEASFTVQFRLPRIIPVSGGGEALRDGVEQSRGGDTLVVSAGTYYGDIDLGGREDVKLVSSYPDDPNYVAITIIDCGSSSRAFTFTSGEDADTLIDGFTIANGQVSGEPGGAIYVGPGCGPTLANLIINNCSVTNAGGGAIYVAPGSNPILSHIQINDCSVSNANGGGLYISAASSPTIIACVVSNCSATNGFGGGAYCEANSSVGFADCTFSGNTAGFDGGGIYYAAQSTSLLSGCVLSGNSSDSGAGICYDQNCISELTGCTVVYNTAGEYGGGIRYDSYSQLTVSDCNISNNSAQLGGGVYFDPNCSGTVADSMVLRNSAGSDGGAIYVTDSDALSVVDSEISYNTAARGGGLYCMYTPSLTLVGCKIRGNEASQTVITYEYYIPDPAFVPDPNDPNAQPPLIPISPIDPNFDPADPELVVVEREHESGIAQGGGVYSFAGPALIEGCHFRDNNAQTSGGGLYFAGGERRVTTLNNCLLTGNSAGRDGAAISTNWGSQVAISSCTVADNTLTGLVSYGGGLYSSYGSYASVLDSIFWGNAAVKGSEIAVASGDPAHSFPSTVDISYSDVDRREGEAPEYINPDAWPVLREGYDTGTLAANDDGSTGLVDIGFEINFYGTIYSQLYVNNNGNVTFDSPMGTFTPWGLTTNIGTPILAPFFADVDTHGTGTVDGRPAFGVNWVNVGYYSNQIDKLNSFQLIIIDRSDRARGDFDIEFNYGQILWETGSASGGSNGFGGESARGGFSNGTGEPGTFYEFEYSGVDGALLDSSDTGLINDSRNSNALGRYIFAVTSGRIELVVGDPIYVEQDCTLTGWDGNDPNSLWDSGNNITDTDPCFTSGYYLSHIDAGQAADSLCIDAGSAAAADVGMNVYSTRTDGVNDVGVVDLGCHYRGGPSDYELTVTVLEDANNPGPHGVVEPNHGWYYEGAELTLRARPDEGYYVKGWYDENGTLISTDRTLEVVMDSNQSYFVRFRQPEIIPVSGGGDAIAEAVGDAENGDVLVIAAGTYSGNIDLEGKEITLTSSAPDDPCVVADTVIDCGGTGRGLIFDSGEDANTVINGLRIINSGGGLPGGGIHIGNGTSPTIANVMISDCNLVNARGAAIYIGFESSPTIINATISNCSVSNSDGGAVYVGYRSSPVF
ncbi:MAG: nidogen-like domain-containing protein, partial [Planctomycetota bacterium]